jgi:hypothetical protein
MSTVLDGVREQVMCVLEENMKKLEERERQLNERAKLLDEQEMRVKQKVKDLSCLPEGNSFAQAVTRNLKEPSARDILHLNISGIRTISVLRSTLTSMEGSMLATKFSGRWDDSLETDDQGRFFINQPPSLFMPLIEFLQCKENDGGTPIRSPTKDDVQGPPSNFDRFTTMLDFYGMTSFVWPAEIRFLRGYSNKVAISDLQVDAKEYAVFVLVTERWHHRSIKSFTITLDEIDAFQIGWYHGYSSSDEPSGSFQFAEKGLGFFEGSAGLDIVRSQAALGCATTKLTVPSKIAINVGSVICCRRNGRVSQWSMDGETIAEAKLDSRSFNYDSSIRPAFAGKGSWRVTGIEYA